MFEEKKANLVSYDIFERGINLPSYHEITREEIKYIVEIMNSSKELK
jgi:dTDP-4-amino-4,6-dideoxygalactose transaminase